jgi:MtrB/PioB family decaheme-associated outer membrane protein
MTKSDPSFDIRRTAIALAVCAACVPLQAQAEEPAAAQTTVSVGLGALDVPSADRALFGQYNGLRGERRAVGLLGVDYSLRQPDNGTWVDFSGSNLLGETRELGLVWKSPGNWKFTADYSELVRYDPNTVRTGLLDAGTTSPQVVVLPSLSTGADLELKTKRTGLGVGFTKIISPALQFAVDLKSENKEGSRLFGVGMNCPSVIAPSCGTTPGWALLMLPEPIKSNHSQIEARLSYAMEKLRVSAGYYGSFYRNRNGSINPVVPGSLNTNTALVGILNNPVALAPDNQAHQFDLSGNYDFTDKTRGTFKLGYGLATQSDDFASAGFTGAPAGVANLGGKVSTKLAKFSLTSRPMPKLTLLADWRYEDRADYTPIALYNTEGTSTYTNRNLSNKKTKGKLQASWQFTSDYRGTLGADYETTDRGVFTGTSAVSGISALRQKTDEAGLRAEMRRRMSESFSGAISVSRSQRTGSNWLKDNGGLGVTEITDPATGFVPTAIFMPTLADRKRDKVKLFADWQPSDKLALQFSAETGIDRYDVPSAYGLRDTGMRQLSIDASYALSYAWNFTAYVARGSQTLNQARPAGSVMAFENTTTDAGVGFAGKATSKLEVGGGVTYTDDRSVYDQTLDVNATPDNAALLAATGGLPTVIYRQAALKMFGKYALDPRSAVRVDLVHQQSRFYDWTWSYGGVPFAYSDGTTVTQNQKQNVSYIGITYVYQLK